MFPIFVFVLPLLAVTSLVLNSILVSNNAAASLAALRQAAHLLSLNISQVTNTIPQTQSYAYMNHIDAVTYANCINAANLNCSNVTYNAIYVQGNLSARTIQGLDATKAQVIQRCNNESATLAQQIIAFNATANLPQRIGNGTFSGGGTYLILQWCYSDLCIIIFQLQAGYSGSSVLTNFQPPLCSDSLYQTGIRPFNDTVNYQASCNQMQFFGTGTVALSVPFNLIF